MDVKDLLKELFTNGNITLNGIDASQISEIMRDSIKVKESKVVASLGEPVATKKTGREGYFYRYRKNLSKGLTKDIVRKDRFAVIEEAYQMLFGQDARLSEMTVSDVYEEWHKSRLDKKSSKTYTMDQSFWENHLKGTELAKMRISSVRAVDIEEALEAICGDHQISRSTLNPILTILRGIWSKAVSLGILEVNLPKNMDFSNIKMNTSQPKSEIQRLDEVFRDNEIRTLRDYLWSKDRDIYDSAILFLSYLGLRIGEMRALTWEDVDLVSGEINITHEIVKRKKGTKTYVDEDVPHTKGYAASGQRRFKLPTPCLMLLKQMQQINGNRKYIFQSAGEYPINPNRINERLRKVCAHLGIRYFSTHKFRFFWISRAYELGIDERTIQLVAGHASLDMTRHYNRSTHKREELSQNQMDAISGYCSPLFTNNKNPLKRTV